MYTYNTMLGDIAECERLGAQKIVIGKSVLGRDVICLKVGDGKPIIVTGGIHAREHVTSEYCMRMCENALCEKIEGYAIYFVPMINPDGNAIVSGDVKPDSELIKINGSSDDFSTYKASARGVDLNVNFPARWGGGAKNVYKPSCENYVGEYPLSEPETQALANFTDKIRPRISLSFHAKGRELYWQFYQNQENKSRDFKIAQFIASELKLKIVNVEGQSAGGYKDYCISKYGIPSFTIELVLDKYSHPLPRHSVYEDISLSTNFLSRLLKWCGKNGIQL